MTRPRADEFVLTVKRSRFHAVVVAASTLEEVEEVVARRRREVRRARHHCWACRVRGEAGRWVEQARDDGEVGRPGMALLQLLRGRELEGGFVVSRVYGGVKLGPGGVARAVRSAAEGALAGLDPGSRG